MSLSSDNLYHFTDEAWKLRSILENGIRVSYSLEDFSFLKEKLEIDFQSLWYDVSTANTSGKETTVVDDGERRFTFAMPMACFCDIPLSMIEQHSDVYGQYAVGLKKDWGIRRGLNPISYVARGSDVAAVLQSFDALTRRACEDNEEYQYRNIFTQIIQMTKPYEGPYSHGTREWQEYRFYDEREWRYIEKGNSAEILSESQLETLQDKVVRRLQIEADDIEKIIVSRAQEKNHFEEWTQANGKTEDVSIRTVDEVVDNAQGAV